VKVRIMDELMRCILGQIFWGVTIASSKASSFPSEDAKSISLVMEAGALRVG
jgi:hypothetical protein